MTMNADQEIAAGKRFQFGANWAQFLLTLDESRIVEAEQSLKDMLGLPTLEGRTFLDIGCGSGLFSLAAHRLGARVHSFDFDPRSVACATELRRRYFPEDTAWRIEQGSALDRRYTEALGRFDIVYSWGVLHHTGAMWLGIENAVRNVAAQDGRLFIAIYNDQGWKSHVWWLIKACYNRLPDWLKSPFIGLVTFVTTFAVILKYTLKLQPMVAIRPLFEDRRERGMSAKYDRADWIGGFPFEFVTFDTLREYLESRGFALLNARTTTSWGCNELALRRTAVAE